MNLKLKRVVRTPYSEEIAIFDADTRDENGDAVNIGKLEVHYLSDQVSGTLLIWQEYAQGFNTAHPPGSTETMDDVIDAILSEVTEPVGLPSEYGVEIYFPSVQNQQFVSNYANDNEGEESEEAGEGAEGEEEEPRENEDFYRNLKRGR